MFPETQRSSHAEFLHGKLAVDVVARLQFAEMRRSYAIFELALKFLLLDEGT